MGYLKRFGIAFLLILRAQFVVTFGFFRAQFFDRGFGFFFKTFFSAKQMIKAPRNFSRQFNMRNLILAYGHQIGPINQNIGCLHQRIAEESVSRQIPAKLRLLFNLIFVGRHPLKPGDWRKKR